jgi:hypothetical protein
MMKKLIALGSLLALHWSSQAQQKSNYSQYDLFNPLLITLCQRLLAVEQDPLELHIGKTKQIIKSMSHSMIKKMFWMAT